MVKIKNRITKNTIIPTDIEINSTGATYNLPEVVVTPQNNSKTGKLSAKDIKDRETLIGNINKGQNEFADRFAKGVRNVADWLPITGNILAGTDIYNAARQGNYSAAVTMAGLSLGIPFVGKKFGKAAGKYITLVKESTKTKNYPKVGERYSKSQDITSDMGPINDLLHLRLPDFTHSSLSTGHKYRAIGNREGLKDVIKNGIVAPTGQFSREGKVFWNDGYLDRNYSGKGIFALSYDKNGKVMFYPGNKPNPNYVYSSNTNPIDFYDEDLALHARIPFTSTYKEIPKTQEGIDYALKLDAINRYIEKPTHLLYNWGLKPYIGYKLISDLGKNEKAMGGKTEPLIKNGKLNIKSGGYEIPVGNGLRYIVGNSHAKGGVPIGPNNKNGVEVEGGEVVQLGAGGMRVFSAEPFLYGASPAQLVLSGNNPNQVFAAQEGFKDRFGINDDGTMAKWGTEKNNNDGSNKTMPFGKMLKTLGKLFYDANFRNRDINNYSEEPPYYPTLETLQYIKNKETFRNKIYEDANGVPTIGYGTTQATKAGKSAFKAFGESGITEQQADSVFNEVVKEMLPAFEKATPNFNKLSPNQKNALFSYYFNVGHGSYTRKSPKLQKALRDFNLEEVANQMDFGYNDAKNPGLRIRRNEERELFNRKKMGGIHIDKNKRGTFTAAATKHGMGVQEFASRVLANKEDYSPVMVKKANFARNASRWKKPAGGVISINGNIRNGLIYTGRPIARGGIGISVEEADAKRKSSPTYGGERPSALSRFLNFIDWLDEKTRIVHSDENHHIIEAEPPIIGPSGPLVVNKGANAIRSGSRVLTRAMKNAEANIKRVNTRIANGTATDNMLEGAIKSEQEYANALKDYENMFDRVGTRQISTTTRGGNYAARRAESINPANLPAVVNNGLYVPNYTTGTQLANAARQRAVLRAQARADRAVARTAAEEAEKVKRAAAAQRATQTRANNKAVEAAKAEADKLRQQRLNLIEEENKQRAAEDANAAINMRQAIYDQRAADNAMLDRLRNDINDIPKPTNFTVNKNFKFNHRQALKDTFYDISGGEISPTLGTYILAGTAPISAGAVLTTEIIDPFLPGGESRNDLLFNNSKILNDALPNKYNRTTKSSTRRPDYDIDKDVNSFTNRINEITNNVYNVPKYNKNKDVSDFDKKIQDLLGENTINESPFVQDRVVLVPTKKQFNIKTPKVGIKKLGGNVRPKALFGIGDTDWKTPINLFNDNVGWYRLGQQIKAKNNKNGNINANNNISEDNFTNPVWDDIFNEPEVIGERPAVSALPPTNFSDQFKMTIPDKIDVDGKVQQAATDQVMQQYNTSGKLNISDGLIGSIIGGLGSLGSYLISNNSLNRNIPKYTPVTLSSQKLKTTYNINPQLDANLRNAARLNRLTLDNTASSRIGVARMQQIWNNYNQILSDLYGTKENKETELINQDRLNAQAVANQEAQLNANLRAQYNERLDDYNRMKLYNTNALFSGINSAVNNYFNRKDQERYYNNTIAAIAARNPNVAAEIFGDAGVDWDTINPYSTRNVLRAIRRKLKS